MKKLLLCVAFLCTSVGVASAGLTGGVNLGWLDCAPTGATSRVSLCNTNSGGGHIITGSFVAGDSLTLVTGFAGVVDIQTAPGATISPWWSIRASLPPGCRPAAMSFSADFTGGPASCTDVWLGGATGGVTADQPSGNRIRLKPQAALPLGDSRIGPIDPGTTVYAFKVTINNTKTVGLGACAGCLDEACLVLNTILVTQTPGTPGGNRLYSAPSPTAHIIWQAWTNPDPQQACPAVTPTKNKTWGSIKAIYR